MEADRRSTPTSLISRENVGSLWKSGYELAEVHFRQIFSPLLCDVELCVDVDTQFSPAMVAMSNAESGYDRLSLHRKAEAEGRRIRGLEPFPEVESI